MKIDFVLDGLPLRGSVLAISNASGANPFAPRISGGMTYRDLTTWSVFEMKNWTAGGMKPEVMEGGYEYSSLDTRFPERLTLPPRVYSYSMAIDGVAAFVETDDSFYMAANNALYLLNESDEKAPVFTQIASFPYPVRCAVEFADRIFVGFGDEGNVISVNLSDYTQTTELIRADLFLVHNGLLFAASGGQLRYTEYEPPVTWEMLTVGRGSERITGLAPHILDELSTGLLYVSTDKALYALLPGDVLIDVAPWPGRSQYNGLNMCNHSGDIYAPMAGGGMVRITRSGDSIPMGPDLGIGPPVEHGGEIVATARTLPYLYILMNGPSPAVYAWSGEGWHLCAAFSSPARGMGYYRKLQRMYVATASGVHTFFLPEHTPNARRIENLECADLGVLITPLFYANFYELTKTWGFVEIWGDFPNGSYASVDYSFDERVHSYRNSWSLNDVSWTSLGDINTNGGSLRLMAQSRAIRLRVRLYANNQKQTPVIHAIVLRYIPRVIRQWQWQIAIDLPYDCLKYRDDSPVPNYSQELWDERIRQIVSSNLPVLFRDIDGRTWQVMVTSFSRRVHDVAVDCQSQNPQKPLKADYIWNLTLLQVEGDLDG